MQYGSNESMPDYFWQIMKDPRITNTQKFFFFSILALDKEQDHPEKVEIPVRSFKVFGVKGHGHIKTNLEALKAAGYLLDIDRIQREDGYPVTSVTINRNFAQMFLPDKETSNGKPKDLPDTLF